MTNQTSPPTSGAPLPPLKPPETIIFTTLSFSCSFFGLVGSFFSLLYFVNKYRTKRTSSTLLFILINVTDGVISFLIVFVGISHITGPLLFTNSIFCDVWGVLWYVAARMSIFLIGFLSISRTYIISRPFSGMKMRRVVIPASVYLVIMLVQQTFVFWLGARYRYDKDYGHCAIDPFEAFKMLDEKEINALTQVLFFICVPLENIFPWLLVLISCILTVRSINHHDTQFQDKSNHNSLTASAYRRFKEKFTNGNHPSLVPQHEHKSMGQLRSSDDNKRTATLNILILTIVYLIFNTFSVTVFSLDTIEIFFHDKFSIYEKISPQAIRIILLLAWVYAVALNSACNVLVYFCRLRSLRSFTIDTITACKIPENVRETRSNIFSPYNRSRQRNPTSLSIL